MKEATRVKAGKMPTKNITRQPGWPNKYIYDT